MAANGPPAVPARAGGIPVLPTGVVRGHRADDEPKAAPVRVAADDAIPTPEDLGIGGPAVGGRILAQSKR